MPFSSCNVPTFVLCLLLLSFRPTSAFALVPPRPSNCIPTSTSSSPAGSTDYDGNALTGKTKQPTPTLTNIRNVRDTRWRLRAQSGQSQLNEQSGDENALLDEELLDEQEPSGQDVRGGGSELVSVSPFDSFLPRGDKLDSYIVKISLPAILNFAINPLIGAVDLFFGENGRVEGSETVGEAQLINSLETRFSFCSL